MGGAINPQDPNSPLYGLDVGRYPNVGPTDAPIGARGFGQFSPEMRPYIPGMINNVPQQPQPYTPQPFTPRPYPGQGNDMAVAPPYDPNAGMVQVQGRPQVMPQKPVPMPGRRIIDPVRPGYGQQPTRGPAPRNIMPSTLQQGLGGLGGFNRLGGMR